MAISTRMPVENARTSIRQTMVEEDDDHLGISTIQLQISLQ